MPNILDQSVRKQILQEIEGQENIRRKEEHKKRKDIYNDKQRQYVLKMLSKEFPNSIDDMRTCTSINLTKRVINEMASIYKKCPDRLVTLADGSTLTEQQQAQINALYNEADVNVKLKTANQKYKLHDQCAVQVVPRNGCLELRVLSPEQYDVVPSEIDQEKAHCYIISNFNKTNLVNENSSNTDIQSTYAGSKNSSQSDGVNQTIADQDDWKKKKIYAWWSDEYNFITNNEGDILSDQSFINNPIGKIPFIDVAADKDFEFFVDNGSGICEFNLDFLITLSDSCNTNRLQSYSQPVISAENLPEDVKVGPNHILFLKLNPDRPEVKPSFEFANPQPDMQASLELQDRLLNYFLTSNGIDPKTISGKNDSQKYASGVERLLSMIDKFEASQNDIDLFKDVEEDVFELLVLWSNALQGTDGLEEELKVATLPDPEKLELSVKYAKPEVIQSAAEQEDSIIKLMESGLISRVEAIAKLRGISEEQALEVVNKIDQEQNLVALNNNTGA